MHHDIYYRKSRPENDEAALQDIIEWIDDEKKVDMIMEAVAWDPSITTMSKLRFMFSFAGISGYPVEAVARAFRPELLDTEGGNDV